MKIEELFGKFDENGNVKEGETLEAKEKSRKGVAKEFQFEEDDFEPKVDSDDEEEELIDEEEEEFTMSRKTMMTKKRNLLKMKMRKKRK